MSGAMVRLAETQAKTAQDLYNHEMSDARIQAEILASIEGLKDRIRQ